MNTDLKAAEERPGIANLSELDMERYGDQVGGGLDWGVGLLDIVLYPTIAGCLLLTCQGLQRSAAARIFRSFASDFCARPVVYGIARAAAKCSFGTEAIRAGWGRLANRVYAGQPLETVADDIELGAINIT